MKNTLAHFAVTRSFFSLGLPPFAPFLFAAMALARVLAFPPFFPPFAPPFNPPLRPILER